MANKAVKLFWNSNTQRGQVSIFLVLIFQVLFLFFAMVINVGMLVHHKINLQNSVDLGAYYGAMKQAEILNAIAHMNYQIRQSWKLLNFRYHILATMGYDGHPALHPALNQDGVNPATSDLFCMTFDELFCNKPIFIQQNGACVNQSQQATDNFCRNVASWSFQSVEVPDNTDLFGIDSGVIAVAQKVKAAQNALFQAQGTQNFELLSRFVMSFRADSRNRRRIIQVLANQLSESENSFKELDGSSAVVDGVQNTVTKNLSEQNKIPKMDFYNSMGSQLCGQQQGSNKLPKWLHEIVVAPLYYYFDSEVTDSGKQSTLSAPVFNLTQLPSEIQKIGDRNVNDPGYTLYKVFEVQSAPTKDLLPDKNLDDFADVVGVEKNPWCLAYFGVHASTTPRLPFMPASISITLEAEGYAKAFGGKIGPWYRSEWTAGDSKSSGGHLVDEALPFPPEQYMAMTSNQNTLREKTVPNYSRYPGDKDGLRTDLVKQIYGKTLWNLRSGIPNGGVFNTFNLYPIYASNNAQSQYSAYSVPNHDLMLNSDPSKNDYFLPKTLDILANPIGVDGQKLRNFELMAVAPDLFDITYYSIEPNFASLYLPKLNKNRTISQMNPRGDLGYREVDNQNVGAQNIIDQMKLVGQNPYNIDYSGSGIYFTVFKDNYNDSQDPIWGRVLTNWTEKSLLDYSLSASGALSYFGKCLAPVPDDMQAADKNPTQGECVQGGRTGYSVKLVSKKYLNADLKLGGSSTVGKILNPPPPNF